MIIIKILNNENIEVSIRKLRRIVEKTGLLNKIKEKEFYEKPTQKKIRKLSIAIKKHLKKIKNDQLPKKLY